MSEAKVVYFVAATILLLGRLKVIKACGQSVCCYQNENRLFKFLCQAYVHRLHIQRQLLNMTDKLLLLLVVGAKKVFKNMHVMILLCS